MTRIVVSGALGRMGKRITELGRHNPDFDVIAGVEAQGHPDLKIVADLREIKEAYDCIIEFTTPKATVDHLRTAHDLKKAMVIGTTGLSEGESHAIREAAHAIPIVFAPNMSVGVNVLFDLIKRTSSLLDESYSIRIREAHHIHKKDKPSGTAKWMADIVTAKSDSAGPPIESIREGETIGDHEIVFESDVDTITLSHSAKTRDILALGALRAAAFVAAQKSGLYSMADVLGL